MISLQVVSQHAGIVLERFARLAVRALAALFDMVQVVGVAGKFHETGRIHQRDLAPGEGAGGRYPVDVIGAARGLRTDQRDHRLGLIFLQQRESVSVVVAVAIVKAQNDRLLRQPGAVCRVGNHLRGQDGRVAVIPQPLEVAFETLCLDEIFAFFGAAACNTMIHQDRQLDRLPAVSREGHRNHRCSFTENSGCSGRGRRAQHDDSPLADLRIGPEPCGQQQSQK